MLVILKEILTNRAEIVSILKIFLGGVLMNFLIYGVGSLGLMFGYFLSKKHNVELVARRKRAEIVNREGVLFKKGDFEDKAHNIPAFGSIDDIKNSPDFIMLSVKSFDIDSSLEIISEKFKDVPVITIQNGIYAEDKAKEVLGDEYVIPAAVSIGSKMLSENVIEQFLDHGMKVGYLNESAKPTAENVNNALVECGVNSVISDNIMKDKWFKFMFYCAGAILNSLTGTRDLEDSDIKWLVETLLDEMRIIAAKLDISHFDEKELKSEVFEFLMGFKPASWSASVGEDLRKGKRTEIDYLNGHVVRLANKVGIDVPFNKTIVSLIKTLEKTKYLKRV